MSDSDELHGEPESMAEGPWHEEAPPFNQDAEPTDVDWVETVEPAPVPSYIPVCSPKAGCGGLGGVLLSPCFVVVNTHWVNSRTAPHLKDPQLCDGCRAGRAVRQKGYAAFLTMNHKIAILEVTQEVLRGQPRLALPDMQLRGRRFSARRLGENRNSRVEFRLEPDGAGKRTNAALLPADIDVRAVLLRVWGMRTLPPFG